VVPIPGSGETDPGGLGKEPFMPTYEERIEVDVPVRTAYDQWTQFEEFPRFMEGVEHVTQRDDVYTEWTVEIGGERRNWAARITEQVPDELIAWASTEGDAKVGGTVRFEPLGDRRTAVTLRIDFEPEDAAERMGDALGVVEGRVNGDLERFKTFIESRGEATGAWRGEVPPDRSLRPENEARSA
jgi:uncharacterized membrane protein